MNSSIRSPTPAASSWSASTGVTVTVSRSAPSSTGRYERAKASNSHSSPKG